MRFPPASKFDLAFAKSEIEQVVSSDDTDQAPVLIDDRQGVEQVFAEISGSQFQGVVGVEHGHLPGHHFPGQQRTQDSIIIFLALLGFEERKAMEQFQVIPLADNSLDLSLVHYGDMVDIIFPENILDFIHGVVGADADHLCRHNLPHGR